jgi:hypothetical protein
MPEEQVKASQAEATEEDGAVEESSEDDLEGLTGRKIQSKNPIEVWMTFMPIKCLWGILPVFHWG